MHDYPITIVSVFIPWQFVNKNPPWYTTGHALNVMWLSISVLGGNMGRLNGRLHSQRILLAGYTLRDSRSLGNQWSISRRIRRGRQFPYGNIPQYCTYSLGTLFPPCKPPRCLFLSITIAYQSSCTFVNCVLGGSVDVLGQPGYYTVRHTVLEKTRTFGGGYVSRSVAPMAPNTFRIGNHRDCRLGILQLLNIVLFKQLRPR